MPPKPINPTILGYAVIATVVAVIFFASDRRLRNEAAIARNQQVRSGHVPPPSVKPDSSEERAIFYSYLAQNITKTHGALLAELSYGMDRAKLIELQSILAERDLTLAELRREHPHAAEILAPLIAKIRNKTHDEINMDFGGEIASQVDRYESSMPERQLVNDVNSILIYDHGEMTGETINRMILLLSDDATPFPRVDASRNGFDQYIKARSAAQSQILRIAASFLTPIQISEFRKAFDLELSYLNYVRMRRLNLLPVGYN